MTAGGGKMRGKEILAAKKLVLASLRGKLVAAKQRRLDAESIGKRFRASMAEYQIRRLEIAIIAVKKLGKAEAR